MNRSKAKALLKVFTAFARGDAIQVFDGSGWQEIKDPEWNQRARDYRVTPKQRLRPWEESEVPNVFVARCKKNGSLTIIKKGTLPSSVISLMEHFERVDERGVCHPCGVWEEVQP